MQRYLPVSPPQNTILHSELLSPESDQYMLRAFYLAPNTDPALMVRALESLIHHQKDINSHFHIASDGMKMLHYVGRPDCSRVHLLEENDTTWQERFGFMRRFACIWDVPLYEFFVQAVPAVQGGGSKIWGKFHHALLDGVGMALLGQRMAHAYAAVAQGGQAKEVAPAQEAYLENHATYKNEKDWERDAAFWAHHIVETSAFPESLLTDDDSCDTVPLVLGQELVTALNACNNSLSKPLSPFRLAFGIIGAYLYRRFDCDAVPVLTASAGRRGRSEAVATALSMQANTLLLNLERKPKETFSELATRVNALLEQALHHGRYPLEMVLERLTAQGEDTSRLLNFSIVSNSCPEQLFGLDTVPEQSSPFGLVFRINRCRDDAHGLQTVDLVYRRKAFSKQQIMRMAEGIKALIANIVEEPQCPVDQLCILGQEETRQLLENFQTPPPVWGRPEATFVDYLRQASVTWPDHIALHDADQKLTYAEVNRITDRLAALLEARGPVRGRFVGLGISRRNAFALAIYAVMKAGGAYLPLDPEYPQDRVEHMLADSAAPLLVVDASGLEDKSAFSRSGLLVLDIDALLDEAMSNKELVSPAPPVPTDLAYMIYTSGSTGKPKGVAISHGALAAFIAWTVELLHLGEASRVALHSSFSFDAAVMALFPVLCTGGSLDIIDERTRFDMAELYRYLGEKGISDIFLTTQICVEFLRQYDVPGLTIATGGEKLKIVPRHNGRLFNFYGPTEFTVISTGHLLEYTRVYGNIPIGVPMAGIRHYILDRNRELLPIGQNGELYLSGSQIASGYWNRAETTASVFVDNPFADTSQTRLMYRTGDLALWNEKGEIEYCGRIDDQVKLRGFRVELGEIEGAILRVSGVSAAVVMVRGDMLAAYFQADRPVDDKELRTALLQSLPEYMIPSGFMQLEAMPLTPNGKTDRKKLPALAVSIPAAKSFASDLQRRIAAIAAAVIGNDAFGADTNLYQAGMSSLSAIKIAASLGQDMGLALNAKDLMRAATVEGIEALLVQASPAAAQAVREKQSSYPLSEAQLGVYYYCAKKPESLIYNIPLRLNLPMGVDARRFIQALHSVVDAHPFLKARLIMEHAQLRVERRDDAPVDIPVIDCHTLDAEEFSRSFVKPFDLFAGPLFRMALCKTDNNFYLLGDFHHLVFDGFSVDVFLRDLSAAYAGDSLPGEKASAFEIGLDEASPETADALEKARAYYAERLAEVDSPTMIPPDKSPDTVSGATKAQGASARFSATVEHSCVDARCAEAGLTPGSLFLGAAALVISRFVSNRQILLSTIHSGRDEARYHDSVGMFVKTLPLALRLRPEEGVREYLLRTQEAMLGAIEHQVFSFGKLAEEKQWKPQINFAFQGGLIDAHALEGQPVELAHVPLPGRDNASMFPFSIEVDAKAAAYHLTVEYDDSLYEQSTMHAFAQCLAQVVRTMCSVPLDTPVASIGMMTEEQSRLVASFNETVTPAKVANLHSMFEAQAEKQPEAVALTAVDRELTFAELNRAANNLAGALLQHGVEPEDRIAFILPRTSRVFCAMLGIMKAGCTFIPIDPEYPADRVRHILDDSGARFILVQGESTYPNGLDIDRLLQFDSPENPGLSIDGERLAYLIYTSGSTGKPKGVMLTHANIINYVQNTERNLHVRAMTSVKCKLVSITTVSFDAFLEDAFCTLMNGLSLVFASEEQAQNPDMLAELFQKTGGTGADFTPSRLLQYLELPAMTEVLSRCSTITVGGEKYPPALYKRLRNIAPNTVLLNSYGPTETTIACNCGVLSGGRITIGRPLWNVVERIVDMDGHPLPPGVVGELWIGGEGVGRGYYGNPVNTEKQFLILDGIRYYRSGDLAKWTENGEVVVLGRNDGQIKLRGLRIELGEIENVLANVPGIRSCAVVVRGIAGREHLSAYYTASCTLDPDKLRETLTASLPRYMVPTAYLQMDKLPETPSGKTDLKSLPEPKLAARREYKAPASDAERAFCHIFGRILNLEQIGADDDFFDLGGSSLLVTRVVIEAQDHGHRLTFADVFARRTPESLAELVTSGQDTTAPPTEISGTSAEGYDYSTINALLAENTLSAFGSAPCSELGNLALTGATGFLGIHILHEYLRTETGIVQCLVRGGKISARERLQSLLVYYFDDSFDEAFETRIRVVEGDVTDAASVNQLAERPVDTYINCAANVKHFAAGSEIERINVDGVKNGLDFCSQQGCRFVQISTTSVAGLSVENTPPENTVLTERCLYFGQNLENKYLHSKFLAERLTLEAAAKGLDAKIMRVGNLMARQDDGEFQINFKTNSFVGALRAYHRIGKIPFEAMGDSAEFAPVDSTASAILRLARTPAACRVFHPYNNHSIFIGDVIKALSARGINIPPCEMDSFEKSYGEALRNPALAGELAPLIAYSNMAGNRHSCSLESCNGYTTQILYRMNFVWPVTGGDYLDRFIEALAGLGFFD